MASRFWAASSSDDESQSDHSESSDEPQNFKQTDRKFAAAFDESDSGMFSAIHFECRKSNLYLISIRFGR